LAVLEELDAAHLAVFCQRQYLADIPKSEAAAESEQLSKAKQLLKRSSYWNRSSSYVQRISLWILPWPIA